MQIRRQWEKWRGVLLFLIITLVCLLGADLIGCQRGLPRYERLPYAGWVLELFGVLTVVLGIAQRLKQFQEDGLVERLIKFFRGDAKAFIHGGGAAKAQAATVSGRTEHYPSDSASHDQKIQYLLQRINALSNALLDVQDALRKEIRESKKETENEIASVRRELHEVRQQTVEAHVGRLGLEMAGLAWIIIGVTLATVPKLVVGWTEWFVRYLEWVRC